MYHQIKIRSSGMGLLASWRESLDILRLKNLKQFMLLTFNAWLQAWKVAWLPITLVFLGNELAQNYLRNTVNKSFSYTVMPLVQMSVIVIFLMSSRPSIRQKDSRYFVTMIRDYLIPIFVVYAGLKYLFASLDLRLGLAMSILYTMLYFSYMIAVPFFVLFYLDTRPWNLMALINSLRNGAVFLWYNLILLWIAMGLQIFITILLVYVLYSLPASYGDWLSSVASHYPIVVDFVLFGLGQLLFSLALAFCTNVYIKRVRDNPSLYV
jgi:hypothetical protein